MKNKCGDTNMESHIHFYPFKKVKKKTLVLDLDETLVHSHLDPTNYKDTFEIVIDYNSQKIKIYVSKRPHLDVFLNAIKDRFEVIVFTASSKEYASRVLDVLDPKKEIFTYRLYREHCDFSKNGVIKDLSKLNRDLSQLVIIDNTPTSYSKHPKNAIPISTWIDDPNDTSLLEICKYLKKLANERSIYMVVKEFRMKNCKYVSK